MTDKKKFWVDSKETHVGAGSYQQTYYTDVKGIKAQPTSLQPKPLKKNPNAKFYFYITTQNYANIAFLADELYGPTPPDQNATEPWFFFTNFNLQIYGMKPIAPGTWVFVPEINMQYEIGDFLQVYNLIQTAKTQQGTLSDSAQTLYGKGVKLLGYAYFGLNKAAEGVASGLELIDDNFKKVKEAVEDLADLGEQAKELAITGNAASNEAIKLEIKASADKLSEKIQTFLKKVGTPTEENMKQIRADTSVEWQKSLISLKAFDLPDAEIDGLNKIITKGVRVTKYSSKLGRILLALGFAETGYNIHEACKANPESPLCAQTRVQDSAGFGGTLVGGVLGTKAVNTSFEKISVLTPSEDLAAGAEADEEISLGEFLGCNVALDAETMGAGFFACTATIWVGSGTASYYGNKFFSTINFKAYEKTFQLIQGLSK